MRSRNLLLVLVAFLIVACQPAVPAPISSSTSSGELVINSFGGAWGQAIQLGLVDSFQRETGIKVTLLSSQDARRSAAAVRQGRLPTEDLIDTNAATAAALERDGVLAPIDYGAFDQAALEKLPAYARRPYALGWGQFAIGLCYDSEVFPDQNQAPKTWADFWNVAQFPGKRSMLAWPDEPQPELGLLADGVAVSALYPIDWEHAFRKLAELRPNVPRFPSDPGELSQLLVDREVVMEACFTHRVQRLIDGGLTRIAISFDQARLQTEYAVIWKDAPNKENALKFLAHMIQAQPQAAWSQIGNTGPINPDAFQYIPEDAASKLPTSPAHHTWAKDDDWYSATDGTGKTNRELLVERWNAWVATACGAQTSDPVLPSFRGALVGSPGCDPGR